MPFITIESSNYNGQTTNITFYPFTGGTINLGTQVIPYTRETENYEGTYDISIPFYGSSCGLQIGASPCVDISDSNGYDGVYQYLGQGYLSYSSKFPDDWSIVCDSNDPKSQALYFYRFNNGIQTSSWIMGNVYESFGITEQVSIVKFTNYDVGPTPCNSSFNWPSTLLAYPTYDSNGIPSTGSYGNPGPAGGTYTLTNNPSCIIPSPTPTPSATLTPTPTLTPTITPTQTLTPTPTITPTPSVIPFDPDAQAYLDDVVAAGGTTDATIEAAVDTLFTQLKSNGLYNGLYFYPMVGGTSASHALQGNRSLSAYDMTWNGGVVHNVSGATMNGTNAYGDTNMNRLVWSNRGDLSMGCYLNGDGSANNTYDMGQQDTDWNIFISRWGGNTTYVRFNGGFKTATNNTTANGMWGITLTGFTGGNVKVLRDASTFTINTTCDDNNHNQPNPSWLGRAFSSYSIRSFAFAFYSTYFTDSQLTTLSTIINDFQTSLGRNTY